MEEKERFVLVIHFIQSAKAARGRSSRRHPIDASQSQSSNISRRDSVTSGEVAKANAKWVDKEEKEEGKGENLLGKPPPTAAAAAAAEEEEQR